jgi:hypothetical protein
VGKAFAAMFLGFKNIFLNIFFQLKKNSGFLGFHPRRSPEG